VRPFLLLLFSVFITNIQAQVTWGAPMDIASSSFGNNNPKIVMDNSGDPMVLWNAPGETMFARWSGSGFTSPVVLNPPGIPSAGSNWFGPDISSHGDTVYAVFKETPENLYTSHIYLVSSYNGGLSFSAPVQVDNIGFNLSRFPTLTTDNLGNPIVAFMKFDSLFSNPQWVVTKSVDYGVSFSTDVLASGWSSPTAEVCDCCPGFIGSLNNYVALVYRDNNSNIRDTWAGVSNDGGNTFSAGMDVDQQNWSLTVCPSSGPDGVIIGDTIYTTFMSAATGAIRVYFNKNSLATINGSTSNLLTGSIPGLAQQNYPRMSNYGNKTAVVWKQLVSGNSELAMLFSNDIANGFSVNYDTVAFSNVINTDVALNANNLFVVWQDNGSNTAKYRIGTYPVSEVKEGETGKSLLIYPNPVADKLFIKNKPSDIKEIKLLDIKGRVIETFNTNVNMMSVSDLHSGVYFIELIGGVKTITKKFLKL
jgi:hypothetical protein